MRTYGACHFSHVKFDSIPAHERICNSHFALELEQLIPIALVNSSGIGWEINGMTLAAWPQSIAVDSHWYNLLCSMSWWTVQWLVQIAMCSIYQNTERNQHCLCALWEPGEFANLRDVVLPRGLQSCFACYFTSKAKGFQGLSNAVRSKTRQIVEVGHLVISTAG